MYSKAGLDHIVDLIKLVARAWGEKKLPYGLSYLAQGDHFLRH